MAPFSVLRFFRSQWFTRLSIIQADLTGQTVVITGGNSGLGFETAKHIARMNPLALVLAVRDLVKGERALKELRALTGYDRGELMQVDMSGFGSVSAFVKQFEERHYRLDVLILNAGIMAFRHESTVDGWESTLQVNVLSTAMLAIMLLPIMIRTAEVPNANPIITMVGSELHKVAKFTPEVLAHADILNTINSDPQYRDNRAIRNRYAESKLLLMLFFQAFVKHLPPSSQVLVTTCDPGFCASGLGSDPNRSRLASLGIRLLLPVITRSPSDGAKTIVWAALAGRNESAKMPRSKVQGMYSRDCAIEDEPGDFVISKQGKRIQDMIWHEIIQILNATEPRVGETTRAYLVA